MRIKWHQTESEYSAYLPTWETYNAERLKLKWTYPVFELRGVLFLSINWDICLSRSKIRIRLSAYLFSRHSSNKLKLNLLIARGNIFNHCKLSCVCPRVWIISQYTFSADCIVYVSIDTYFLKILNVHICCWVVLWLIYQCEFIQPNMKLELSNWP